ncbi:rab-GTPase-TBC domain protein (macronuclear) [Tetrahymena thermophila SB210]|uniref:Rab-GTPase-TBC domain protein n=1 Tax=Tetrahymena thermophila (strain SB210) TaxID=312017 RepID=Q23QD2_TETTS|nr:rab-GTPase-TBC domain protein [Tetrahymena thermophila SB210]EAR98652.2 rab-GTPase-TBC domain protein [Tetrahymena thermophila SB210]|eukprot:XP_001018897.2 rab-GTPase-TBC domain protein [Tetrahymena thermophila SB210]
MNTDHQIKQLKEAVRSSEMMIMEQSRIIISLNLEQDGLNKKLEETKIECSQKIEEINKICAQQIGEKDIQIRELQEKTKELMLLTQELEQKNSDLEKEYQNQINDLERQLIDAKLQLAQQSSDFEETKRDMIQLKRQIQELSSESDKTSNSPSQSLIISDGIDFSTSQIILNEKSMLRDIDISFKNSAIQKNKEFLKNLNAPPELNKNDSIDFFSPEQCNLRVLINPEYDSFPVIEKNGSIEIDFIPSPIKSHQTSLEIPIIQQAISSTPQKSISYEKQQEFMLGVSKINKILITQHQPQVILLNEKEKEQIFKALEESSINLSLLKTYNSDVIPIIDTHFLYSSIKSEMVQQKMINLLRKNPCPQSLRKRVWPYLIGNKLRINKKLYKNLENQMNAHQVCQKTANLIREDMHRTYPNFSLFDKGSQINETLQAILEQFNHFRPDIGYVQGMAYPAAIIFLYLGDSYLTFKYFSNLIAGSEFISNLYKFKIDKIKIYVKTFEYFLSQKYPNCLKHLQKLHIQSDIFLIEWFYTLYCRAFSFSTIAKIWDLMLAHGEVIFYKVGISIFGCIEKDLIDKDFDDSLFLIRNCTNKIDPDSLIKMIYSLKLTTEHIFKKYQKLIEENDAAEKSQKKIQEPTLQMNSLSNSQNSTQISSSYNGVSFISNVSTNSNQGMKNSGIKSENLNDNFLKAPKLETIDELNSSTHSTALKTCQSNEEKQEDCITTFIQYEQVDCDSNKENVSNIISSNNYIFGVENINMQFSKSSENSINEQLSKQQNFHEIVQN